MVDFVSGSFLVERIGNGIKKSPLPLLAGRRFAEIKIVKWSNRKISPGYTDRKTPDPYLGCSG